MLTSPCFAGFFAFPPLYIRLELFSALRDFAEVLPRTKQIASNMLDFPLPLGPRTQLNLGPKSNSVNLAKLLKPCVTNLFILVILTPFFDSLVLLLIKVLIIFAFFQIVSKWNYKTIFI